jgi:hypothetical protein
MINEHKRTMSIGGFAVPLPTFFPSISTVKTNLGVSEYLRLLVSMRFPQFLVSAYDIFYATRAEKKQIYSLIKNAEENGQTVLLDSGNYESYWKPGKQWRDVDFAKVLKTNVFNLAFCYDNQNPPSSLKKIADHVERAVLRDQKHSPNASVVPIIHAQTAQFPEVVADVAKRLRPILVAVPERGLGDGILARAETVFKIRKKLDLLGGTRVPLHLLGTGNPISVLVYSMCGADSFDGLEWCQTTVNHDSGLLYHFQQRELFGCQSSFCSDRLPYIQGTLAHNLVFYMSFMARLQASKNLWKLSEEYLPKHFSQALRKATR